MPCPLKALSRPLRRSRFLVVVCLPILLLGSAIWATAGVTSSGAATQRQSSTAEGPGSVVQLVVCPTTFGVSFGKPAAFPALTTLAITTPLARSLAAYTDTQGLMTVVGPRGWRCSASYGADGSGGVTVTPRGSHPSEQEGIVGGETSACYSCRVGQACPLFPDAARALRAAYRQPCPSHRPARESVDRLSSTVVAFEDPPYVKGDGALSGGPYPANGVMTYIPGNDDGSWIETCTLPDNVHSTCTAILNDFLARYRSR